MTQLDDITLHDRLVASDCNALQTRAVTVGAGAVWSQETNTTRKVAMSKAVAALPSVWQT